MSTRFGAREVLSIEAHIHRLQLAQLRLGIVRTVFNIVVDKGHEAIGQLIDLFMALDTSSKEETTDAETN